MEEQYKAMFLAEALDNLEEINRIMTSFEKNPTDKKAVDSLFRITHTLKGNAVGLGYSDIAHFAHLLEDLFSEIRDGNFKPDPRETQSLFKGLDKLGELVHALKSGEKVSYLGIQTKLEVLLRTIKEAEPTPEGAVLENELVLHEEAEDVLVQELEATEEEQEHKVSFSDQVQVPVYKLDALMNLVGELIIEKDRILASQTATRSSNEFARLNRISSDLQYSVMDVRLVQVGFLFNKFHRVVRDAAIQEEKEVDLKLAGTDTEIDRNILQVISDSLIHLIRNCIGHGIETPEERIRAGKPARGTILLAAENESDDVVITIKDDGKGLDHDRILSKAIEKGLITAQEAKAMGPSLISQLIFEPGFSTSETINAISGRGVGMDVVKQTTESIGGSISIQSVAGEGTTIQLSLPSTMAVKSCLLSETDKEVFAIPLGYTDSVISIFKKEIHSVGNGIVATHLGNNISLVFLKDLLNQSVSSIKKHSWSSYLNIVSDSEKLDVVVVRYKDRSVGIVVDRLLQQKEIMEKPLSKPIEKNPYINGVTILGTGNVCLVLNIPSIFQLLFHSVNSKINGLVQA
jgi:two-component system chemotaxis sensor kinase CheA